MIFLVKTHAGELSFDSENQIRDAFLAGKVRGGDLVTTGDNRWSHVGDLPAIASFFATKPTGAVEAAANIVFVPGKRPYQAGPFTLSELKARISRGEFAPASWVSVEGSGQWKQLREVPALKEAVPPLPGVPAAPVAAPTPAPAPAPLAAGPVDANMGEHSVRLDLNDLEPSDIAKIVPTPVPSAPAAKPTPVVTEDIEREDPTMSISVLGLNLSADTPAPAAPAAPAPAPAPAPAAAKPVVQPAAPAPTPAAPPPAAAAQAEPDDGFDGITAEIPVDPIWLVKQGASENISGPFRFLDVVDFLKKGKLTKNDKISKLGTNRFQKIAQQYEFNVSYSIETVVRGGVEVQKIFIRRRHPRVAYVAAVQVTRQGQIIPGHCVNISGGGIMVELPKATVELGEMLQVKILPDLIPRQIVCNMLVIGKIPKIPPGFALKFENLSKEDKEAIEFFVSETLKREQAGKQNAG